jgi:hypothetical protein
MRFILSGVGGSREARKQTHFHQVIDSEGFNKNAPSMARALL